MLAKPGNNKHRATERTIHLSHLLVTRHCLPSLRSWRKDALQRDAVVQDQIRHHVVVRKALPGRREGLRRKLRQIRAGVTLVSIALRGFGQVDSGRRVLQAASIKVVRRDVVIMEGHFRCKQRDARRSARLTEIVGGQSRSRLAPADMNRRGVGQIWQGEGGLAIASVERTKQRKERCVLRDGQELAVTLRPATRGEIASKYSDLRDKW